LAFTWKERYLSSACSRAAARPEAWLCMLWSASRVSTWMDRYGDCQEQSVAIRRNPSQSVAIRRPPARIEHLDGAVISGGDCCEGSRVA
jgi:hypothetical protein